MKKISRIFTVLLSFLLILGSVPIVSYAVSGKGTLNDPYIVTTAEDVNNIRKNLSAHYKLGNSIDMSSIKDFSPIGTLARPFKGSFSCDVDSSGKPKYAIYNLSVKNSAGELNNHNYKQSHSDYSRNNSKWETGLFGAIQSATVTNICVLNANIISTVLGTHSINSDFVPFAGTDDEMGTAILVGIAKSSKITGCTVSGMITSASNETGALAGGVFGTTVKNCYANATVALTGTKHNGLMFGYATNSSVIDSCGVDGKITYEVKGPNTYKSSGFIGCAQNVTVSNCYTRGEAPNGDGFCYTRFGGSPKFDSCYSSIETGSNDETDAEGVTVSNCFQLTAAKSYFPKSGADAAKSYFAGKSEWDTSGSLPEIKALNRNVDYKSYSTEAMSTSGGTAAIASDTQQTTESGDSQTEEQSNNEFLTLLNSLPETITLENKEDVKKLKKLYEGLSDADFADVTDADTAKYNSLITQLDKLLLPYLLEQANKLPAVSKLTSKDKAVVKELYEDYNFLSDDMKSNLSEDVAKKIKDAYKKLFSDNESDSKKSSNSEKVIIIVLIVANVLCIGGMVTMLVLSVISYRRFKKKCLDDDSDDEDELEQ